MQFKRLYIFTGKGGVGKTTLSLAFTQHLKDQGKKVKIAYFKTSKLDEKTIQYEEVQKKASELGLESIGLDLLESAKAYIGKKLGSTTMASWVVRTPFFKSLINMIPGFNYLIYMGQVLEYLKDDPDLHIVLDSPSSGHALTMFEATKNFNQIFQKGALYEDTQEMLRMLKSPHFIQVNVVTLPTTLAMQESQDFIDQLARIDRFETKISCNYSLIEFQNSDLPESLKLKVQNEQVALNQSEIKELETVPFCLAQDNKNLTQELLPSMQNLV